MKYNFNCWSKDFITTSFDSIYEYSLALFPRMFFHDIKTFRHFVWWHYWKVFYYKVPYYYGGVDSEVVELVRGNTEDTELSFNGCLRNMRMNNQRVGGQHEAFGVIRCSSNVEPGIFFGGGARSHVILRELQYIIYCDLVTACGRCCN